MPQRPYIKELTIDETGKVSYALPNDTVKVSVNVVSAADVVSYAFNGVASNKMPILAGQAHNPVSDRLQPNTTIEFYGTEDDKVTLLVTRQVA